MQGAYLPSSVGGSSSPDGASVSIAASPESATSSFGTSSTLDGSSSTIFSDSFGGGSADVIGELRSLIVERIRHPEVYEDGGIEGGTSMLLYGPDSAEMTRLVKAIAEESGVSMLGVRGPEIFNSLFGESEKTLRDLAERTKYAAPSILFFEDVDLLRGDDRITTPIVGQLATIIKTLPNDVYFIATSTKPEHLKYRMVGVLDALDHRFMINYPDKEERIEILDIFLRGTPLAGKGELFADALQDKITSTQISQAVREMRRELISDEINGKKSNPQNILRSKLDNLQPATEKEAGKWSELEKQLGHY